MRYLFFTQITQLFWTAVTVLNIQLLAKVTNDLQNKIKSAEKIINSGVISMVITKCFPLSATAAKTFDNFTLCQCTFSYLLEDYIQALIQFPANSFLLQSLV